MGIDARRRFPKVAIRRRGEIAEHAPMKIGVLREGLDMEDEISSIEVEKI